jgi:hypothetical protein
MSKTGAMTLTSATGPGLREGKEPGEEEKRAQTIPSPAGQDQRLVDWGGPNRDSETLEPQAILTQRRSDMGGCELK